ncbi:CpsD/CapB family tyrosine-protein kinase [Alkalihalobacterium bogoriense]|uniref:CpsD/CapB family tyrosine-protein kinase n=1 Tax=Alkalihalobacterium bogoriense TaxID=246272 RepID=UPI000B1CDA9D|nr:CpsD/CapB family tyrosine-protein kinase [Alkalihalobacterium bogoriense]
MVRNHIIKSLITLKKPDSIIAEQFETIRTNLEFSAFETKAKAILITSPTRNEGKTLAVTNLAFSFAKQGKSVLLIDTDVRKGKLHEIFKLKNDVGLTNILIGQVSYREAIIRTHSSKVDVLTSGPVPSNTERLFSSDAMVEFIEKVKAIYDYVIFDSLPILEGADTKTIASRCDGVIMVVRNGKTERELAIEAKAVVDVVKANMIGVIFNGKSKSLFS